MVSICCLDKQRKVLPSHIQEPLACYCAVLLCVLVRVVNHLLDASLINMKMYYSCGLLHLSCESLSRQINLI